MSQWLERVPMPGILWLLPVIEAIHHVEEPARMPDFASQHPTPIPMSNAEWWVATQAGTLFVCWLTWYILQRQRTDRGVFVLMVVLAGVFFNVLVHLGSSIAFGVLSPGVVSAVLLTLPYCLFVFWLSLESGMVKPRQLAWILILGLIVKMPIILVFLGIGKLLA